VKCPDCGREEAEPHRYDCSTIASELNKGAPISIKDYFGKVQARWDNYYYVICKAVASKSPCHSRQIGALLVKERIIVATGFNGPARGYPHCADSCPRRDAGFKSGEGLNLCPATHAEINCIASAARVGTPVSGTTLYMNCIIPCKDCMNALVNAGVKEAVLDDVTPYHKISVDIAKSAGLKLRRFNL